MPWKLASFNLISILFIFKVIFLISTLKSLNLCLLLLNGNTLFSLEWCNSQRPGKEVSFQGERATVQLDHCTRRVSFPKKGRTWLGNFYLYEFLTLFPVWLHLTLATWFYVQFCLMLAICSGRLTFKKNLKDFSCLNYFQVFAWHV